MRSVDMISLGCLSKVRWTAPEIGGRRGKNVSVSNFGPGNTTSWIPSPVCVGEEAICNIPSTPKYPGNSSISVKFTLKPVGKHLWLQENKHWAPPLQVIHNLVGPSCCMWQRTSLLHVFGPNIHDVLLCVCYRRNRQLKCWMPCLKRRCAVCCTLNSNEMILCLLFSSI